MTEEVSPISQHLLEIAMGDPTALEAAGLTPILDNIRGFREEPIADVKEQASLARPSDRQRAASQSPANSLQ